jgi:hypothetical protein
VLKQRLLFLALGFAVFLVAQAFADDVSDTTPPAAESTVAPAPVERQKGDSVIKDFTFTPSGFGTLQMLRFVNWKYDGSDLGEQTTGNVVANITLDFTSGKDWAYHIGMEGYVWYNTIPIGLIHDYATMMEPQWSFYVHRADAEYFFGKSDDFNGELDIGYFPYKYNPDVRNLGEYMFRSGTYPGWLITNFDWSTARLAGIKFSSDLFKIWHNDFLATSETAMFPYYDVSLSWLSSIKPFGKVLDIGAGVDLARVFPVNDFYTTPKTTINLKQIKNTPVAVADTVNGVPGTRIDTTADSSYYTYSGTKLMGRLVFDFKGLLPDNVARIFGENDGRLYSEVCVLGLENQGVNDSAHGIVAYYDKLWQRIPIMFGFNVPTFKILDVLSLEAEYYRSPYPDDFGNQLRWSSPTEGCPVPAVGIGDYLVNQTDVYNRNFWKWSVYASKTFNKHFMLIVQAARDHSRTSTSYPLYADGEECFVKPNQWYWAVKAVSVF